MAQPDVLARLEALADQYELDRAPYLGFEVAADIRAALTGEPAPLREPTPASRAEVEQFGNMMRVAHDAGVGGWWGLARFLLDRGYRPDGRRRCRVCGCTEQAPCPGGCRWVPGLHCDASLCTTCERVVYG